MRATGGTIAINAGVFGTLAAIITLVVGLASAFEAENATRISWSEWGGVVFSFGTIFLAAICLHVRSVVAGLLLMLAAVGGALVGGMFVAMFMTLAFAGGALASYGAVSESESVAINRAGAPFESRDGLHVTE